MLSGLAVAVPVLGANLITDIGTLNSTRAPRIFDANNQNRVVGSFFRSGDGEIGFTWAPGEEMVPLTLPGFANSYAIAVNERGRVVGTAYQGTSERMFSWTSSGGIVDLGDGQAIDINVSGVILGSNRVAVNGSFQRQAFVQPTGQARIPIGDLGGGSSFPQALSDNGHVVGASLTENQQQGRRVRFRETRPAC